MKYLSVCSGIEAASVAWASLGWEPVAFSEIEPFPSAVLAERFPGIPNLGDMTQYENWNIGSIDLLVGGTPCQAFSVAGKRGSLSDERGNLCLTFCEIADKFSPQWILWENVPGVLNTPDNAFGCLLGELCGADAPVIYPGGGRFPGCGVVSGQKRTVAWRILDAQWNGVPQRRKRVFVLAVAGAGNWSCANALLPVGERVPRDLEAFRKAWKAVAGDAGSRVEGSHWDGGPHPTLYAHNSGVGLSDQELFRQRGAYLVPDVSPSVTCKWAKGTGGPAGDEAQNLIVDHRISFQPDVSATLDASYGRKWTGDQYVMRDGFLVFENHAQDCRVTEMRFVCSTVSAKYGTGGGNTPIVLSNSGYGKFIKSDTACTLTANCGHPSKSGGNIVCFTKNDYGRDATLNMAPTLRVGGKGGGAINQCVCLPVDIRNSIRQSLNDVTGRGFGETGDPMYTLTSGGKVPGVCCIQGDIADGRRGSQNGLGIREDVSFSLLTSSPHCVAYQYIVRRLTPRECERLQGFPDDWTLVSWKGKPAEECPDSHRYRAVGNSMAVPVMRYIGHRIQIVERRPNEPHP